jgi:uncharacterized membrane protein YebE (DUF533 family)
MFDARKLLDALMGAAAQIGQPGSGQPALEQGNSAQGDPAPLGLPPKVSETVQQVTGQTPDQLLGKARNLIEQNPGLAQAAAIGVAGLLFASRKPGRGLPGTLARLGGLAVIGGLAYKAFQNSQAGKTLLDNVPAGGGQGDSRQLPFGASAPPRAAQPAVGHGSGSGGGAPGSPSAGSRPAPPPPSLDVPQQSLFHPISQTEDDALLYVRTMVAAAACDGHVAESERSRIVRGLTEAGIDPQATGWLERELASPADVEELAAGVSSPEKAAQVYAAARITIDPDTIQEREFLRQLAEALDLDQAVQDQIDSTAAALKVGVP